MQSALLQKTDDELVQIAREELGDLIGLTGEPVFTRVVRWNQAMPQYHVGHGDRVHIIEEDVNRVQGLSLLNNALHGVGIAPVIQRADHLARDIVSHPSGDSANSESGG